MRESVCVLVQMAEHAEAEGGSEREKVKETVRSRNLFSHTSLSPTLLHSTAEGGQPDTEQSVEEAERAIGDVAVVAV
jgi:hypothetical protein